MRHDPLHPLKSGPPSARVLVVNLGGPDARGFVFSVRAAADATGLTLPDGAVQVEGRVHLQADRSAAERFIAALASLGYAPHALTPDGNAVPGPGPVQTLPGSDSVNLQTNVSAFPTPTAVPTNGQRSLADARRDLIMTLRQVAAQPERRESVFPQFEPQDLVPLLPLRTKLPTMEIGPQISFPGDGRFAINAAGVGLLSPGKPLEAIRLFLAETGGRRFLVVVAARRTDAGCIGVTYTGKKSDEPKPRTPAMVQARSIGLVYRTMGLICSARFNGRHDPKHNWLVFPLDEPLPYIEGGPADLMGAALAAWLDSKGGKRPVRIKVQDLMRELVDFAKAREDLSLPYSGEPATPLATYLRLHADELRKKYHLTVGEGFGGKAMVTIE